MGSAPSKHSHHYVTEKPGPPGKPILIPSGPEAEPDVISIRWDPPVYLGGLKLLGYLVEHRRTGSPHWVRATPVLVKGTRLTLSGLEPGMRYQFRVSAENDVGRSDPGQLSEAFAVSYQRHISIAPSFVKPLVDTTGIENEKVELTVVVDGTPTPKISWFKDGFELFSNRRQRILIEGEKSSLIIHQAALNDEGEIKCTATNKAGHVVTKANLTLEAGAGVRLPRQYEEGLIFELGEDIKLRVGITGKPEPVVKWYHNGSEVIHMPGRVELSRSEKHVTLRIEEAARSDRGEYRVTATNKLGTDSASILVTITDKPLAPGKAQVVMTMGRCVTLSWTAPNDDGGCKIGNYIVEYYRNGWNMWLKAATCRQLSTTLGDLIEGSEYKFRVKAENPYGISEPSEESDLVFIPDPKRGLLEPPPPVRNEEAPTEEVSVEATRKHKELEAKVNLANQVLKKVKMAPKRMWSEDSQGSPPPSPEKDLPVAPKRKNRDKRKAKAIIEEGDYRIDELEEIGGKLSLLPDKRRFQSMDEKTKQKKNNLQQRNSDNAKSYLTERNQRGEREEKDYQKGRSQEYEEDFVKYRLSEDYRRQRSPHPPERQQRYTEDMFDDKPDKTKKNRIISLDDRWSRSPVHLDKSDMIEERMTQKSVEDNKRYLTHGDSEIHSSSEMMLVLLPDRDRTQETGGETKQREELEEMEIVEGEEHADERGIILPMSLSSPELSSCDPIDVSSLRYSVSSSELLHERSVARMSRDLAEEEAEAALRTKYRVERKRSFEVSGKKKHDDTSRVVTALKDSSVKPMSKTYEDKEEEAARDYPILRKSSKDKFLQSDSSFEEFSTRIEEDEYSTDYDEGDEFDDEDYDSSDVDFKYDYSRGRISKGVIPRRNLDDEEEETYHPRNMALAMPRLPELPEPPSESPEYLPERPIPLITLNEKSLEMSPPVVRRSQSRSPSPSVIEKTDQEIPQQPLVIIPPLSPAGLNKQLQESQQPPRPILKVRDQPEIPVHQSFGASLMSKIGVRKSPVPPEPVKKYTLEDYNGAGGEKKNKKKVRIEEPDYIEGEEGLLATGEVARNRRVAKNRKDSSEASDVLVSHYSDIVKEFGSKPIIVRPVYLDLEQLKEAAQDQLQEFVQPAPDVKSVPQLTSDEIKSPKDFIDISVTEETKTTINTEEQPDIPTVDITKPTKYQHLTEFILDLFLFIIACYLYLLKDARLAIPVILLMAYRQLHETVSKQYNKYRWLFQKKND